MKRAFGCAAGRVSAGVQASPCQSIADARRLVGHPFPPHVALGRERGVREDRRALDRAHRVRVGGVAGARCDAEEAGLGIDRVQATVAAAPHPGDVVADRLDLPARQRRHEHREVGLAAGRREGARDVVRDAFGRRQLEDQHVLGQPALVAGEHRGDAQGEALLAEQRVAPVAGAERPDLARLGEVGDRRLFGVARPRHIGVPGLERCADRVHARHERAVGAERVERALDAGHDAHARGGVGRVGQLHADLRRRGAERSHREGHHVHRAAAHRAAETVAQLGAQGLGLAPVVRGPRVVDARDVGALLDPCDIARVGACEERVGPQCLVERGERACFDEDRREAPSLCVGAVAPHDVVGCEQRLPLGHPVEQRAVLGCGSGHLQLGCVIAIGRERTRGDGVRAPIHEDARAGRLIPEPLLALRARDRRERDQVDAREPVDHTERVAHDRRERRRRPSVEQQHADAHDRLARRPAEASLEVGEERDHQQHPEDHAGLAEQEAERHHHGEREREVDHSRERARPQRGVRQVGRRHAHPAGFGRASRRR